MPHIERLFTGGMDANTAAFGFERNTFLNGVNMRLLLSADSQQAGAADFLPGNTEFTAFTAAKPAGTNTFLGKTVDEVTGRAYTFFHNGTTCSIIWADAGALTAGLLIDDTKVTGGLGFSATSFISARVFAGLLIWTDNLVDIRYLDLAVDYMAGSAISQSQLTVVTEPPAIPLVAVRNATAGVTSTIQHISLQFSWRFVLTPGFTSVLSPNSLTSFATRESALLLDGNAGNTITLTADTTQKIPSNWKMVEFVVRFPDTDAHYVIKRWTAGNTADNTAINNHNSGSALTLTNWSGALQEALSKDEGAKPFDSVPLRAAALEIADNRLVPANITEGYDTPKTDFGITNSLGTYTPAAPASTTRTPYMIVVHEADSKNWYFAVILRFGPIGFFRNYLLPREVATGVFIHDDNNMDNGMSGPKQKPITGGLFQLPSYISQHNLIEMDEQGDPDTAVYGSTASGTVADVRLAIINEANEISILPQTTGAGNFNWYLFSLEDAAGNPITIEVEDDPAEYGPSGSAQSRALLPVEYRLGCQLYDSALRKPGVIDLGPINPAAYDIDAPSFTQKVSVTTPSGVLSSLPDYATYFSICLSRASRATRSDMFFGGIVKALFKEGDGTIVYRDRALLTAPPTGLTVYGIGVPIPKDFTYNYVAGDKMLYSVAAGGEGIADIIGTYGEHIVLQFTNDAVMYQLCDGWGDTMFFSGDPTSGTASTDFFIRLRNKNTGILAPVNPQKKTAFTLLSGFSSNIELYEIGNAFGPINGSNGSKSFGNFYTTASHTVDIMGDMHTRKGFSDAGGGVRLAMTPRSVEAPLVWVSDRGRIAPTDTIGQKTLETALRASNTHIQGASINGIASFDALDIWYVDRTAGAITALQMASRGQQEGGRLLVLCKRGSFVALVGKQELTDASGATGLSVAGKVFGSFNSTAKGSGCNSPRSVVSNGNLVWWVDAARGWVMEFNDAGAHPVSDFKCSRLFLQRLSPLVGTASEQLITGGINPVTREYMVSIPAVGASWPADLNTVTGLPNPFEPNVNQAHTWIYNYEKNVWTGRYSSGAEFFNVGNKIFGWYGGKVWREFTSTPGSYYGTEQQAILALPFNEGYPVAKTAKSLQLSALRPPTNTWVMYLDEEGNQHVADANAWERRPGSWYTAIRRDRSSNGAAVLSDWERAGINGGRIQSEVIYVAMLWDADGGSILASSLGMEITPVLGMVKPAQ